MSDFCGTGQLPGYGTGQLPGHRTGSRLLGHNFFVLAPVRFCLQFHNVPLGCSFLIKWRPVFQPVTDRSPDRSEPVDCPVRIYLSLNFVFRLIILLIHSVVLSRGILLRCSLHWTVTGRSTGPRPVPTGQMPGKNLLIVVFLLLIDQTSDFHCILFLGFLLRCSSDRAVIGRSTGHGPVPGPVRTGQLPGKNPFVGGFLLLNVHTSVFHCIRSLGFLLRCSSERAVTGHSTGHGPVPGPVRTGQLPGKNPLICTSVFLLVFPRRFYWIDSSSFVPPFGFGVIGQITGPLTGPSIDPLSAPHH